MDIAVEAPQPQPLQLHGFLEIRQCPGDARPDQYILGRKKARTSEPLTMDERVIAARKWQDTHICSPIPCGTSRRVKAFLADCTGGILAIEDSEKKAMDVEDAD